MQPEPGASFAPVAQLRISDLRIAVTEDFGLPVEASVRERIRALADALTGAGAIVEEAKPDLTNARRIFHILRATGFRRRFGAMTVAEQSELKDTIRWNLAAGEELTVADYDWVDPARAALIGRIGEFFSRFDLLIGPTTQVLPFDLGTDWLREVEGVAMETYIQWMESCSLITVTGCPALSPARRIRRRPPGGCPVDRPAARRLLPSFRSESGGVRYGVRATTAGAWLGAALLCEGLAGGAGGEGVPAGKRSRQRQRSASLDNATNKSSLR